MENEFHLARRDAAVGPRISNPKVSYAVNALPSPELQRAIRDDYRLGKVEPVQGWIVSKTEAELIRLTGPPPTLRIFALALND